MGAGYPDLCGSAQGNIRSISATGLAALTVCWGPGWHPEYRFLSRGDTAQPQIQCSRLLAAFPLVRSLRKATMVQNQALHPALSPPQFPWGVGVGWGAVACQERRAEEEGVRPGLTSQLLHSDSSGAPCLPAPLIAAQAQLAQLPSRPRRVRSGSSLPLHPVP